MLAEAKSVQKGQVSARFFRVALFFFFIVDIHGVLLLLLGRLLEFLALGGEMLFVEANEHGRVLLCPGLCEAERRDHGEVMVALGECLVLEHELERVAPDLGPDALHGNGLGHVTRHRRGDDIANHDQLVQGEVAQQLGDVALFHRSDQVFGVGRLAHLLRQACWDGSREFVDAIKIKRVENLFPEAGRCAALAIKGLGQARAQAGWETIKKGCVYRVHWATRE